MKYVLSLAVISTVKVLIMTVETSIVSSIYFRFLWCLKSLAKIVNFKVELVTVACSDLGARFTIGSPKEKFQQTDKSVEDKNENWRKLLNRSTEDILPSEKELFFSGNNRRRQRSRKPLWFCKMGRLQLGLDDIPAEAEADRDSCQHVIKHAIQTFQQDPRGGGSIGPVHWTKGSIIKLLKKTDLSECSNYRGTMLQSTPGKVLNTFLLERVKEVVNPKLLRPSLTVDGTNPVSTRSSAWASSLSNSWSGTSLT